MPEIYGKLGHTKLKILTIYELMNQYSKKKKEKNGCVNRKTDQRYKHMISLNHK